VDLNLTHLATSFYIRVEPADLIGSQLGISIEW